MARICWTRWRTWICSIASNITTHRVGGRRNGPSFTFARRSTYSQSWSRYCGSRNQSKFWNFPNSISLLYSVSWWHLLKFGISDWLHGHSRKRPWLQRGTFRLHPAASAQILLAVWCSPILYISQRRQELWLALQISCSSDIWARFSNSSFGRRKGCRVYVRYNIIFMDSFFIFTINISWGLNFPYI